MSSGLHLASLDKYSSRHPEWKLANIHGSQHTLDPCTDPTVPSGGKAYLVKAVQARASEVSHDLVGRKEPFPQECLGEVYNYP